MSYANGIGNAQQVLSPNGPSATRSLLPANALDSAEIDSKIPTPTDPNRADEMNLSSTGGLMAQALEVSDTRYDKVAALQQTIAAGTYSVPSSAVADKIIGSLLD